MQMAFPLFRGSENCSASLVPYFQVLLRYCEPMHPISSCITYMNTMLQWNLA